MTKAKKEITPFTKQVIRLVKQIPKGKVATYGQIASLTGRPNAVRGVVWILNSCAEAYDLPWQRVINAKGQIAFRKGSRNYHTQRKALEREGVEIIDKDFVDLFKFQWKKKYRAGKSAKNKPKMFG